MFAIVRLIIILFAYWEVASIIFLGLHDKLQIAKVIYAVLNLFCIRFCESVCVCVFVCVWEVGLIRCVCGAQKQGPRYTCIYMCTAGRAAIWNQHFSISFVMIEMDVSAVSWKDFCCMVAPSHCPISFSPGRERPGIWGDRPRLAHKSLPWGPLQSSDFIILRLFVLWSGWRCIPATVAFSWYELAADCGTTQSTQNCQGYSASIWLQ